MGLLEILEKISQDGIRVEVAFDEKSIRTLMIYGLVFAVVGGIATALIRKALNA